MYNENMYRLFSCVVKLLYTREKRRNAGNRNASINQKGHVLLFCLGFVSKTTNLVYKLRARRSFLNNTTDFIRARRGATVFVVSYSWIARALARPPGIPCFHVETQFVVHFFCFFFFPLLLIILSVVVVVAASVIYR